MRRRFDGVAGVLFLANFAAQSSVIALSPVLDAVAADFGVTTTSVGQLRTLSGVAAAATAFALPWAGRGRGLRTLLMFGSALLAAASLAAATAPAFAVLAAAHVAAGVSIAILVASASAAAAEWAAEERRTQVLSWALIGQPAAWIVGMPIVGALGEINWRLGWLALPLAAATAAALLLARRPAGGDAHALEVRLRPVLARPLVARWALAELLMNCGWSGTLVYSGALFIESYGASTTLTGGILGAGAAVYVGGNLASRRLAERRTRLQIVVLALVLALVAPLFGAVTAGVWTSTGLFAATAFVAGARTLVGSAFGLAVAPDARLAAMGVRTAAAQVGSVVGAGTAGLALATAGYGGLGVAMGAFFAASAVVLLDARVTTTGLLRSRTERT